MKQTISTSADFSRCQNCDVIVRSADLPPIADLEQRVESGEPMPSGECPECGALCQPFEPPTDEQMREAAKNEYEREGEIEIDDNAAVSRGDDTGAYVQAWVWVSFDEAEGEGK